VTILNPISRQKVFDEIEFYLVENPFLKIEPPEERYPKDKPINLSQTFGRFIGTDYTFIHDKHLRDTILNNMDEEDRSKFYQFKGYKKLDIKI